MLANTINDLTKPASKGPLFGFVNSNPKISLLFN
jgi:hypothetical protein